jgi:hypothetical protein
MPVTQRSHNNPLLENNTTLLTGVACEGATTHLRPPAENAWSKALWWKCRVESSGVWPCQRRAAQSGRSVWRASGGPPPARSAQSATCAGPAMPAEGKPRRPNPLDGALCVSGGGCATARWGETGITVPWSGAPTYPGLIPGCAPHGRSRKRLSPKRIAHTPNEDQTNRGMTAASLIPGRREHWSRPAVETARNTHSCASAQSLISVSGESSLTITTY